MTKHFIYISFFFLAGLFTGCSQVLQTVDLDINLEDSSLQEEFNVVEKTLTIKEAKAQKAAPYLRAVLKNGRGEIAKPIPEKLALKSEFPKNEILKDYKLGVGDTIALDAMTHVPGRIGTETDWTDVAGYNHHIVGIRGEGKNRKFYAWGDNSKKQISLSDDAHFATPQEIFLPANPDF